MVIDENLPLGLIANTAAIMGIMNLITKGRIKKTLIFPAFAGGISVLLFQVMRGCSGFIILGEDHVDLLGSCAVIFFCVFVNLCNKIFG